jgi:tetratricopeptide (TPR) repeat protein
MRISPLMVCALSALVFANPLLASDTKQREQWKLLNARVVTLLARGQLETALPLAIRAVELAEQDGHPEYPVLSDSLHNLAEVHHRQYRHAKAEPLYKRALDIQERAGAKEYPEISRELDGLGKQYFMQRKFAAAEEMYRRSLSIKQQSLPADSVGVRSALGNLALVLESMNDHAEAASLLETALAAKADQDSVDLMMSLARIHEKLNRIADAEAIYVKALWETRGFGGLRLWKAALVQYGAATFYERQNRFQDAERLFEKALSADAKIYGRKSVVLERNLIHLANVYRKLNKDKKAVATEARLQQVLAADWSEAHQYFRKRADEHRIADAVTLIVSAYVAAEGSVHTPEVVLSSGQSQFDDAALTYMRRRERNPVMLFGVAIGHRLTYRLEFRKTTPDGSYMLAQLEDLSATLPTEE